MEHFSEFARKFPLDMSYSEKMVLTQIYNAICCAKKELKKHPQGQGHIKYTVKAYKMLEEYFVAKSIDPDNIPIM